MAEAPAPQNEPAPGGALRPLSAPRPLAEDAADLIRQEILSGGFRQGEHLVEARIAKQLNVSRGPVREAFKLLRAEGLVDEEPRRGTFVVRLSARDVREIYDLRAGIEARAAAAIARAKRTRDTDELRGHIDRIEEAASAGDVVAVSRHDLAFHDALCRLSGNDRLQEVFQRYVPMLRPLLRLDEQVYRSLDEIGEQHRPIVDAIAAGDAEAAARRCGEHCEHAGELISAYIDGLPERES
jgi:GntR family transcriptional regulator of gluconate operon